MKTLRFKVGDLARVVYSLEGKAVGLPATIHRIVSGKPAGNSPEGVLNDYLISIEGYPLSSHPTALWGIPDAWLEPLPPDADHLPPAVRSIFNVTPNQGLPVGPRPRVKA